MIYPVQADVGRLVCYNNGREVQEGRLTSLPPEGSKYRDTHVFVRFRGPQGELTPNKDLVWL